MGATEKNRGKSFEYWLAERLRQLGWDADRNPLSGSSFQISSAIAPHDVRAYKRCLKVYFEAKKTSKSQITLHKGWFDKLRPAYLDHVGLTVEPLVFAFQPEPGGKLHPVVCLRLEDFDGLISMLGKELHDKSNG